MRTATSLAAAALFASGCALIVGIEDHTLATTSNGGGGTGTTTSSGTSSSGGGSAPDTCAKPDAGSTSCPGGLADCDGDGSCETAVSGDAKNCGACGHDCLGGACESGVCQEVALTDQFSSAEAFGPMTVSGGRAYYAAGPHDANVIYSVPVVTMGAPKMVSTTITLGEVYDIAVSEIEGAAYATAFESGTWGIWGMQATGGTPVLIHDLGDYTNGLAIHPDSTIFIAELHRILAIPANESNPNELVTATGDVIRGLAIDGQYLYWASYPDGGSGKLGKISRATQLGKDVTVLASGLDQPEKIALDDTSVYWTDSAAGTISVVPKQGGSAQALVTGQTNPQQIAVSGDDLYWSADAGFFHVRLCALGTPVQLTNDSIGAIGIDPKRAVVTDTHFHQVLGFAR